MRPNRWSMVAGALALSLSLCVVSTSSAADRATGDDFVKIGGFKVEIDGVIQGSFKSVEGLSVEVEVVEYKDGNDMSVRKRPGRVKYGDITLKRGYLEGKSALLGWIQEAGKTGGIRLHPMTIIAVSPEGKALHRWNCFQCFPRTWKMSSMDARGNEVLTEEVVVVIESFEEA